MKTFTVTITETVAHTIEVEAETSDAACEIATEILLQDGTESFVTGVEDRSSFAVEKK